MLVAWWSVLALSCVLLVVALGNKSAGHMTFVSNDKKLYDPWEEHDSNSNESLDMYKQMPGKSTYEEQHNTTKCRHSMDNSTLASQDKHISKESSDQRNPTESGSSVSKELSSQTYYGEGSSKMMYQGAQHGTLVPGGHVTTVTRKYFHLVMLLVYIPGLMFNYELLFLASCLAAAVLVLLEVVNIC